MDGELEQSKPFLSDGKWLCLQQENSRCFRFAQIKVENGRIAKTSNVRVLSHSFAPDSDDDFRGTAITIDGQTIRSSDRDSSERIFALNDRGIWEEVA